jgi:anti-sigma factor RsiW
MTCRECNEFLIDYRSDNLTPDERASIEAHLAWCSPCVVFLSSYEETIRLAKGAFHHPDETISAVVPEELRQRILAARLRVQH